ncbi:GNAT family N-acetyltransferase [Frankia sp. QA3]|uniref:GNAT family N-acetyltransferase n=1 Tax=Frankia sp. QA3 TaxID=710111 RepID=UPI000269C6DA|nr:GNAT family N-acetyltransferase [Frankia sp. QA3]EIV93590.1 putative acetyltransferase [Frankia sp. QA3]
MDKLRIRLATTDDLPALLELYRQLARFPPGSLPTDMTTAGPVLARILGDPARRLTVAETGGQVVGTADLMIVPNLTHDGRPWAIVENVVVDHGSRRLGVGQELMTDVVRAARSAGCYKIQLLSRNDRSEAHLFYKTVGFDPSAAGFRMYLD